MIKEIDIVNFQSHKSTHLDLVPGVNVIVGASDSGKSAIIRALRWLIWNRPVGDAFISHWADGGFVNIVTDQMDVIQRAKGPGGNQYRINEEIFKAFGNDVPQPIQEILNLDETNLQRQGDSPFLISATPGEVSGYFNKIAKLDKIDSSLKYITSQAKSLTGQIKFNEQQLETYRQQAEKFRYLDTAEVQLEVLEEDLKRQNQRRFGLQTLRELHAGILYQSNLMGLEREIITREEFVDDLLEMLKQKAQIETSLDDLRYGCGMLISYAEAEENHSAHQKLLDPVDEILYNYTSRNEVLRNIEDLKQQVREISMLAINTKTKQIELSNKGLEFHENMPEECPLCGK